MNKLVGPVADIEAIHAENQSAQGYPRWDVGHEWPEGKEVLVYTEQATSIVYHPDGERAAIDYDDVLKRRVEDAEPVVLVLPDPIDPATVNMDLETGKLVVAADVSQRMVTIKGEEVVEPVENAGPIEMIPIAEARSEVTLEAVKLPETVTEVETLDETWTPSFDAPSDEGGGIAPSPVEKVHEGDAVKVDG